MLVHAMMQHQVTKEEFIGYGAVILMIESASKSVRKQK
jgi:hypothetical protein